MAPTEKTNVWDRQPDETTKAYRVFCLYRDFPGKRSLDKVWIENRGKSKAKRAPGQWRVWSGQYRWVSRVEAYDAHIEKEKRALREDKERKDYAKQLSALSDHQREVGAQLVDAGLTLLARTIEKINALNAKEITPALLPRYMTAATGAISAGLAAQAESLGVEELLAVIVDGDQS